MNSQQPHGSTESKVSENVPSSAPPSGATTQTLRESTLGQSTQEASPGDWAGKVLGDYELLDKLGAGGMGVVYRAKQRSANRMVAFKVIRPDRLAELAPETRAERR